MRGDKNTAFFHVTTMIRRQRNKIKSIKNFVGEWITDMEVVKNHTLDGFSRLFTTELKFSTSTSDVSCFSHSFLSEKEKTKLCTEVTDEEIKTSLWAHKPFKAPGVDGFHASFYQHFWLDVRNTVCMEVKKAFQSRVILEYLNKTLIGLIPKCPNPEMLGSYRPIGLCTMVYKLITKTIISRIRPYLDKLISVQTTFVPGRRGLDNILIAQELVYSIGNKKGKEAYMAIKVDLEKTYDRLEWNFIHKVLIAYHFPEQLIKLIMSCVSTTSISILFNRSSLESFYPSRDIRQRDPLSPYLFILYMEYLRTLIERECLKGDWVPIKASKNNTGVSHLFFANDLMLFAKASEKGSEAIKEVLNCFCSESG